jgi:hypothetical protein
MSEEDGTQMTQPQLIISMPPEENKEVGGRDPICNKVI